MCGISGVYHFGDSTPVDRTLVEQMNEVLHYRGPDAGGLHVDGRVGLGNRRLAIVDRAHGAQPMTNVDGTLWITYNGEIYNHRALRSELQALGCRFATQSDTEVVLQAYAAWGSACVERFNGQFAFAIWDAHAPCLFLARDHLGITPLHYAVRNGRFLFASEAKALFADPSVPRSIDPVALAEALLCGTLFHGRTMFRDVHALEPGCRLTVTPNGLRSETYWDVPLAHPDDAVHDETYYADRILPLLEDALRCRLAEEVPWGLMLSGGTDSSTLVHMAACMTPSKVQTFTIDFPNRWKGTDMDAHYAALLAARLGTDHHAFMIEPEDYFEELQRVTWHVERPFNKGALTMYLLYRAIKQHATVVITGEGADELFAGYVGSRGLGLDEILSAGRIDQLPWAAYWVDTCRLFDGDFSRSVQPEALVRERWATGLGAVRSPDLLNNALYLYTKYFLLELLELHDRTSLAFGVEARLPFIDHRLIELLAPMPSALKVNGGRTKYLFKKLVAGILPAEIIERGKTPMPIPRDPKTISAQLALARDLVCAPNAHSRAYFDRGQVEDFLGRKGAFAHVNTLTIWKISMYLITVELLQREFA